MSLKKAPRSPIFKDHQPQTAFCHPSMTESLSRRQLLHKGVSLTAYLSTAKILNCGQAQAQTQPSSLRRLVWINMSGGWDILEVTDPKPSSTSGIDMTYSWDLAPTILGSEVRVGRWLPKIAGLGDELLVVRGLSMGTTSHQAGSIYMDTGILANTGRVNVASIPSIVASGSNATIPIIQLAGGSEPLIDRGVSISVVRAQNLALYRSMYPQTDSELQQKQAILDHLKASIDLVKTRSGDNDRLTAISNAEEKIRIQLSDNVGSKLSLTNQDLLAFTSGAPSNFSSSIRDAFALALKLIRSNLVTCVNLGIGGFDTHASQESRLMPILLSFDYALRTFVNELKASGALDNTLIVCYSDFGRTPKVNSSNGRDHWPVGGALMLGGGIKGGRAVGGTDDKLGAQPINVSTGEVDPAGTIINPANLGGSVIALTLGEAFVKSNRSYLSPIPALTETKT